MFDSIRRELFKTAFENLPSDKDDSPEYPELKGPDESNPDVRKDNNGKKSTQKCKEGNNGENSQNMANKSR